MSFKTTMLPEKMLRMISKADRQKMGKSAMLSSEAQAVFDSKSERELQSQIGQYLSQRGIPFVSPAFGKRTRIKEGWPDYTLCFRGRFVAFEAKAVNGKLTDAQSAVLSDLQTNGGRVYIVQLLEQVKTVLDAIEREDWK